MLQVVSAVIIEDGRILLTQRAPGKAFEWCWETPGGKVDPGESDDEALMRELKEELGVEAEIQEIFFAATFVPPRVKEPFEIVLYRVRIKGVPKPLDAIGIGWFRAHDVKHLKLMPSGEDARSELVKLLNFFTEAT
jgi:8-oxo-dGTP diphosphatase